MKFTKVLKSKIFYDTSTETMSDKINCMLKNEIQQI